MKGNNMKGNIGVDGPSRAGERLNVTEGSTHPDSLISIKGDNKEIMRLENNGRVFWLKDGKMTQAKIDKDLAQAFKYVIAKITNGLDEKKIIEDILKNNK